MTKKSKKGRVIVENILKKDRKNKRKMVSLMYKSADEIAGFKRKEGSYDNLWDWKSLESI